MHDEAAGTALIDQGAGRLAAHAALAAVAARLGQRQGVRVHGAAEALRTLGAVLVEVEVAAVAPVANPVAGDAAPVADEALLASAGQDAAWVGEMAYPRHSLPLSLSLSVI